MNIEEEKESATETENVEEAELEEMLNEEPIEETAETEEKAPVEAEEEERRRRGNCRGTGLHNSARQSNS